MGKYDDLHFFIDESGQFRSVRRDLDLVGGVLMFGPYDSQSDEELRSLLRDRLAKAGGQFPRDLHFFESGLSNEAKQHFLRGLGHDIRQWEADQRATYGLVVIHSSDVFANAGSLLAEANFDNRYLGMLWALVEHICFVDGEVAERLTPQAKIHLHIAHRRFQMPDGPGVKEDLGALGWQYRPDRRKADTLMVSNSTTGQELRGMIRMALRQRWPEAAHEFGEVHVDYLDYDQGRGGPAALYLADLQLGLLRLSELSARKRYRAPIRATLLQIFRRLEYGPWMEWLAEAQASLNAKDLAGYLSAAGKFQASAADLDTFGAIVQRQEQAAVLLAAKTPTELTRYLEDACAVVDEPGRSAEAVRRADLAVRLFGSNKEHDARAELLALQVYLSHANHTGDILGADAVWQEYVNRERGLHALGEAGLRLKVEFRNRRAVSLVDQFRYAEAEQSLHEIVAVQEDRRNALARSFGIAEDLVPARELGACYGTLGQVYAFQDGETNQQNAASCFRRALELLSGVADRERQWVYLGHHACDLGATGKSLWNEVVLELPEVNEDRLIVSPGGQFLLALQLKGKLVFASTEHAKEFLTQWAAHPPLHHYPVEVRSVHPFGLIQQSLGLLNARLWRETGREDHIINALAHFDAAAQHLDKGETLLKVLSRVCRLRRWLFVHESQSTHPRIESQLQSTMLGLKGLLAEHFGTHVWSEDEFGGPIGYLGRKDPGPANSWTDRAKRILAAIRFNYW